MDDLAAAHVLALRLLMETGRSETMNCGYGHGYSVREVADVAKKVTGIDFAVEETGRRAGDPPALVADSRRIRELTGWQPRHDDIEFIVRTAWEVGEAETAIEEKRWILSTWPPSSGASRKH